MPALSLNDIALERSPFQGLSFYTESDAKWFFGRTTERRIMLAHLRTSRLTLLYAARGVGKSSLLLQALGSLGAAGTRTLLVSGEESPAQVRLRAERLGVLDHIAILAETELELVCDAIRAEQLPSRYVPSDGTETTSREARGPETRMVAHRAG